MNERVEQRVPVLVVGGSLVGLSMSVFLGRLGVPHMLVERHSRTSHHPRGRGNNLRTMELFRVAGLDADIRQAASVLRDNHGILQADTLAGEEQEWLFRQIDPGGRTAGFSPASYIMTSITGWHGTAGVSLPIRRAACNVPSADCSPRMPRAPMR